MIKELERMDICQAGRQYLSGSQKDIRTIIWGCREFPEFLIDHAGTVIPLMRTLLSEDERRELQRHGILLDHKGGFMPCDGHDLFVIGDSSPALCVQPWAVVKAYVLDGARANFQLGYHSYANIECYGRSSVTVGGYGASGNVYLYGQSGCETDCEKVSIKRMKPSNAGEEPPVEAVV